MKNILTLLAVTVVGFSMSGCAVYEEGLYGDPFAPYPPYPYPYYYDSGIGFWGGGGGGGHHHHHHHR